MVKESQYYHAEDCEFLTGVGAIYTEFTGQAATRQISLLDGTHYASSSLQDYDPAIGYILYDGLKDDLDLSLSREITKKEFEAVWSKAVAEENEGEKS